MLVKIITLSWNVTHREGVVIIWPIKNDITCLVTFPSPVEASQISLSNYPINQRINQSIDSVSAVRSSDDS